MKSLSFKTKTYRKYAPFLFKSYGMLSKLSILFGQYENISHKQLQEIKWDRFLSRMFLKESRILKGEEFKDFNNITTKGDIAYILGCGASINELSDKNWSQIKENYSIGVNYFYNHHFSPDIHIVELGKSSEAFRLIESKLINNSTRHNESVLVHIRHLLQNPNSLEPNNASRIKFYSPLVLKSREEKFIESYLKRHFLDNNHPLIHHASNLDCAIHFACKLGYKDIRLLGVDLGNSDYFWNQQDDEEGIYSGVREAVRRDYEIAQWNQNVTKIHASADRKITEKLNCLDIVTYINLIDRVVLKPNGIKLSVCNEQSLLSDYIATSSIES
ncbi:hypothetical protein [Pseudoalteromonas sp. Ps84H-4]|uniref:hypothetical protein n=1 Tax=Pseudoalteromonas sp. Ps84H-4 TaxID=2954502 RepID=UPI0020968BFE|nr:hypothetical protein [Pseudoalteromonas sp. Ps84H-4]MCO7248551.1 hypothetical protein [Pseudoalteromonas sp. Ps84H-4]